MKYKRQLSKTIRCNYSIKNRPDGIEIRLIFERKVWLWFYSSIYPHQYLISIHDFWDLGMHSKGGPMYMRPMRATMLSYSSGYWETESWKPGQFNLNKRIVEIYLDIISNDQTAIRIQEDVKASL